MVVELVIAFLALAPLDAATTGKRESDPAHGTVRLPSTGDVAVIGADPIAELRRHNLRLPIDASMWTR